MGAAAVSVSRLNEKKAGVKPRESPVSFEISRERPPPRARAPPRDVRVRRPLAAREFLDAPPRRDDDAGRRATRCGARRARARAARGKANISRSRGEGRGRGRTHVRELRVRAPREHLQALAVRHQRDLLRERPRVGPRARADAEPGEALDRRAVREDVVLGHRRARRLRAPPPHRRPETLLRRARGRERRDGRDRALGGDARRARRDDGGVDAAESRGGHHRVRGVRGAQWRAAASPSGSNRVRRCSAGSRSQFVRSALVRAAASLSRGELARTLRGADESLSLIHI